MKLAWWWKQAAGGIREQRDHGLAEGCSVDVSGTAEGVLDCSPELLPRRLDGRIGPRRGPGDPAVVDLGAGLAEDDVLDPVRPRPAGVATGLEPDAPRLRVTGRLAGGGGLQVVPRGRGIARPDARVVPDQAFHGALGEDAGELAVGCLSESREAGRRGGLVRREIDEVERQEHAVGIPLLHQAGTGQARHVGQVAAGDGGRQRGAEVALAGVVHGHAGALEPRRHHRVEVVLLGSGPRRIDADLAADVLALEAAARCGAACRRRSARALAGGWCRGGGGTLAPGSGRFGTAAACGEHEGRHPEQRAEPEHPAPLTLHAVLLSGQPPSERLSTPPKGRAQLIDRRVPCDVGGPVEPRTTSSVGSSVRCATARSAIRSSKARPAACPSSKAGRRTVVSGGSK